MGFRKKVLFSLQSRLLVTYLGIILTVITFIFLSFTIVNRNREREQYYVMLSLINDRLIYHFQTVEDDILRHADLHVLEPIILEALGTEEYQDARDYYQDLEIIKKIFRQSSRLNSYFLGVTYVGSGGALYDNTGEDPGYLAFLEKNMAQAAASEDGWYVSPVHTARIHRQQRQIVTYTKSLINPYTRQDIGFVNINMDFNRIFDAYQPGHISNMESAFWIVQEGQIIYHSEASEGPPTLAQMEEAIMQLCERNGLTSEKPISITAGGSRIFLVAEPLPGTRMTLIQSVPMRFVDAGFQTNLTIYLLIVATLMLVAVALTAIFSSRLSRPVRLLVRSMEKLAEGIPQSIPVRREDELGVVIRHFNEMSRKIAYSTQQARQSAEAQRISELRLLQAQINPHFIHNTLNLISSIANLEGQHTLANISTQLSRMIYYNLKTGDFVTLQIEIEQVQRYMEIQEIRFPGKFKITCRVEDALERMVPKFILQPLVENAVYHGLEKKMGAGSVSVTACIRENWLELRVEDDGLGIPPDILEGIHHMLAQPQCTERDIAHMGLWNVHDRIRYWYGAGYGLSITSVQNEGTCVVVRLPAHGERVERP